MSVKGRSGGIVWRIMRWLNPRLKGRFQSGGKPGQLVLLLTTSGRKTGSDHVTPLQYELVEKAYYVASARGRSADWYCNILSNPEVKIEVNGEVYPAYAEAISDPKVIADFFELRLSRHPRMMAAMLRVEGLPVRYTRKELEKFASKKALVILHPSKEVDRYPVSIQKSI